MHALHVWHARPEYLATRASHAVIARCFFRAKWPLPAKIKLQDQTHRSIAGRTTGHQRLVFDVTMRPDGHYSLVWAGSVLRKWGSNAMHRPKHRPPDS